MNYLSPEYQFYMQSEAWDAKRRQRLAIDNYTCQGCDRRNKPLDVHHVTYERFGRESMDDLLSLCRDCHNEVHGEPVVIFDICRTCGQFLAIAKQTIEVLGTLWTQFTCQDGHIRSYRDE